MTRNCDFCQAAGAPWNVPSENFVFDADPSIGSDGAWAACDRCVEYVRVNDRAGLVKYIVSGFVRRHRLPAGGRRMVTDRVESLTKQFWAAKNGAPYLHLPSIDGDTQRSI
jgi:hypothetical protein